MTIRKENTMKTKFRRILAAVMATATMAIGCGGMSANAQSWGLYNTPGAPSSATQYSDPAGFYISNSRSSVSEKCTSYSSNQQSNGTKAKAYYNVYAVTSSGSKHTGLSGAMYHEGKDANAKTVPLSITVPAASTIYGNYSLLNYSGITCSIYGTIS